MGDSGSLLISYVTAFLLVKNYNILSENSFYYSDHVLSFMILPVLDLFRLFVRRYLKAKIPSMQIKITYIIDYLRNIILKKYFINFIIIFISFSWEFYI